MTTSDEVRALDRKVAEDDMAFILIIVGVERTTV